MGLRSDAATLGSVRDAVAAQYARVAAAVMAKRLDDLRDIFASEETLNKNEGTPKEKLRRSESAVGAVVACLPLHVHCQTWE